MGNTKLDHGDFGIGGHSDEPRIMIAVDDKGKDLRVAGSIHVYGGLVEPDPIMGNIIKLIRQAGKGGKIIALTEKEANDLHYLICAQRPITLKPVAIKIRQ